MVPVLPPPFLHTINDQKLDGGKAWLPDPSRSRCTAQFMSLMSTINVLTDLHTLTSNMLQFQKRSLSFAIATPPTVQVPIRLAAPTIFLYAPSLSPPPVQVPTGYWSLDRFIRSACHHCCPHSLLLLLLLLLVAIATYWDINNGKPVNCVTLHTLYIELPVGQFLVVRIDYSIYQYLCRDFFTIAFVFYILVI